jgi:hypothetical protein
VSCATARACIAVGFDNGNGFTNALAERWNGARWVVQRTPHLPGASQFLGVSCPTPRACIAVGMYSVLHGSAFETFAFTEAWKR